MVKKWVLELKCELIRNRVNRHFVNKMLHKNFYEN